LANSVEERKGRRMALKIMVGAGILAIVAVVASGLKIFTGNPETSATTTMTESSETTSATGVLSWPRLKVTHAESLETLKALKFNYPLETTPNLLVKLGVEAEDGVGPDGDIVAFSAICQHEGCTYNFLPPTGSNPPEGVCGCHSSHFDFVHDGDVIAGPSPRGVPRVLLEYDQATGNIYVVGMAPPNIYGHGPPGVTDPAEVLKYDLQGGQIVTEITLSPACC
jgi:arsenite oxidase small subunit